MRIFKNIVVILCSILFLEACKNIDSMPAEKGLEMFVVTTPSITTCTQFDVNSPQTTLEDTTLLTGEDIVSFNWPNQFMKIKGSKYSNMKKYLETEKIFPVVLTIDGERIYSLFYKNRAYPSTPCFAVTMTEEGYDSNGNITFSITPKQKYGYNPAIIDNRFDTRVYDYFKQKNKLVLQ